MSKQLNHLKDEHSPYLLQHAANPVDWYPWSDEALQKAKNEDKLLIISIGYAACHWCHVMEHESFEDPEVAALMNGNYVSVKVDREERPDIDQIYMDAAFLITGRGGWPLNVVALPGGEPVYAGTYFPKHDWINILRTIAGVYRENREGLELDAMSVRREMLNLETADVSGAGELPDPDRIFTAWSKILDIRNGGTHGSPKFPMPVNLAALLHLGSVTQNKNALSWVEVTLDKMAAGGIYDHLGGGFSRYSTDARWHIPHFEKMLYDNAQLVKVYSEAYKYFRKERYREVVYDTLEFVRRELTTPEGLFYSSLDADSDGREGAFYVWTADEVMDLLGTDAGRILEYYGITESGNWEKGDNVLYTQMRNEAMDPDMRQLSQRLFEERSQRKRPALDYKIISSWNAMMISACVSAAMAFSDDRFAETAVRAGIQIKTLIREDGSLIRSGGKGAREISGFLEDYAFLIAAYTDLYQLTFDGQWLNQAGSLLQHVQAHFSHENDPLFYFTSGQDPELISRKTETGDNVIPSSNAVMARNLLTLGHLLSNDDHIRHAEEMVKQMGVPVSEVPYQHGLWVSNALLLKNDATEISIVGENWKEFHRILTAGYLPEAIFSGGVTEGDIEILQGKKIVGKTVIYVCRNKTCSAPVESPEDPEISELFKKF